jgi:hypothetical protein
MSALLRQPSVLTEAGVSLSSPFGQALTLRPCPLLPFPCWGNTLLPQDHSTSPRAAPGEVGMPHSDKLPYLG